MFHRKTPGESFINRQEYRDKVLGCWTGKNILSGMHLGTAQCYIKMRMLCIAGSVSSMFQIKLIALPLLCILTDEKSAFLLGCDICYETFFRFEIVTHRFRFIHFRTFLVDRLAHQRAGRVRQTNSMYN